MTVDEETIDRDDGIKKNYVLLRNYDAHILSMRGVLLTIAMKSITQVEEGRFQLGDFSDENKPKVKSMLQMDIISGIMMYVEDLAILSESFRKGISYYKMLDPPNESSPDVGSIICGFFERLNSFSDEEFRRILGYADPSRLNLTAEERDLVEAVLRTNIAEMRSMFAEIKKFGDTHHPAFRRFKHAGAPLMPGWVDKEPKLPILSGYDSYILVLKGRKLLEDVIPIPLSEDVLTGYGIIIHGVQTCLQDLVRNHIECIRRNLDGILPREWYFLEGYSEKKGLYEKLINKFYDKHPLRMDDLEQIHLKPKIDREDVTWYLDLPDFLRKSKGRKRDADKIQYDRDGRSPDTSKTS